MIELESWAWVEFFVNVFIVGWVGSDVKCMVFEEIKK